MHFFLNTHSDLHFKKEAAGAYRLNDLVSISARLNIFAYEDIPP